MAPVQSLQKKLQKGGLLDVSSVSQEDLSKAADALGMTVFVVNCDRARSRSAVLRAIARAVDFPEYFGSNLDALSDCLCDTVLDQKVGVVLCLDNLHSGDPALADDAAAVLSVCADTVEFAINNDRYFAYAVQHAGKHPDPEPGIAPTPYSGHRSHE
ncbi:barstar family protein [Paralcaligenes ureilyticus]|jgi:RNAse (barnase) inhibitor barstar|uniref:Barstar (Barnase inhibitor) n=1 Tax=Paralcaligenes ureilyticus TaxID=627131 RepID=A0A4R3MGL4_9BURK|nr:barstar family protein [Paralcaligenes ureilyticus]TCT10785.1 barstar (barnase inhibitor) [Paralcaligenes ureilyticus]